MKTIDWYTLLLHHLYAFLTFEINAEKVFVWWALSSILVTFSLETQKYFSWKMEL